MNWTRKNQQFSRISGYQHWSRTLLAQERLPTRSQQSSSFLEPIVLRLIVGEEFKTLREARKWLQDSISEGKFLSDPFEQEALDEQIDSPNYQAKQGHKNSIEDESDSYALYRLINDLIQDNQQQKDLKGRAEILEVGKAIETERRFAEDRKRAGTPERSPRRLPVGNKKTPIVAIIDDGIGFLNNRFRTGPVKPWGGSETRFHAIWLQAFETIFFPRFGSFYMFSGQVLHAQEINALLNRGPQLDEEAIYRELNAQVVKPGRHRSTEYSFSHGSHVLDVAAGADPSLDDPVSEWPLLAVQLPSEAVDNTAGTQLEPSIVQGVKWILAQAETVNSESPVIINISFGTMAGPKDGTKPIEHLVAKHIDAWQKKTGRCARVVFSNGNARLRRQVARCEVAPDQPPQSLAWRILPDDHTACFAEIRTESGFDIAELKVGIATPRGESLRPIALPPGTFRLLKDDSGRAVAALYHVPARPISSTVATPAYYLLATAPTADGKSARADAGAWRITLVNSNEDCVVIPARVEVQRGETPIGYELNGRQSYLDDPAAFLWEPEVHDYNLPTSPITRDGTQSSFASTTLVSEQVASVGAAQEPLHVSARYSGAGSSWTVTGPTVGAVADYAPGNRGVIASGTFSGSTRQLNGSSVAAAKATHYLARLFSQGGCVPSVDQTMQAEMQAVIAQFGIPLPASGQVSQLGLGIITEPAGARAR